MLKPQKARSNPLIAASRDYCQRLCVTTPRLHHAMRNLSAQVEGIQLLVQQRHERLLATLTCLDISDCFRSSL